jgi:predicted lipoprotein with Yx(FWY)xxD motif
MRKVLVPGVVALALLVAGCGDDGDDETTAAVEETTTTAAAPGGSAPSGDAGYGGGGGATTGPATVASAQSSLGNIVTDAEGRTLYLFAQDDGTTSSCYDSCATAWPPLLTSGPPTVEGDADAALVGTTERRDGTTQVTYAGRPLYLYAQDTAAGDVNGQGLGGNWFVLAPDGKPIS